MSAPPRPYGSSAKAYLAAGYWPLPLPPRRKASPPEGYTGRNGREVSAADVDRWTGEHRSGNIGVRLPPSTVGIDIDAHKGDEHLAAWDELAARCGPLPDAPWCSSRDDGISGIRLFRVPGDWEAAGKLPEGSNGVSPGEVIQWHHRYVVCPPSIHPDTGRAYRWRSGSITRVADLPALPQSWLDALSVAAVPVRQPARPVPAPRTADQAGRRPGDDFGERADWLADILGPHGWELHHESGGTLYVTRPGKGTREGYSATIGHSKDGVERLYVFSADAAPFEMETPYSKFSAYALLNHGGSHRAAARELGRAGYGTPPSRQATAGSDRDRRPSGAGGGDGEVVQEAAEDVVLAAAPAYPAVALCGPLRESVDWAVRDDGPEGDGSESEELPPPSNPMTREGLEKLTKQERCLQLARTRYDLRRAAKWPYLLCGERKYLFGKPDRQALRADLRHAWREKFPDEAPPPDTALNSVIEDLKRLAVDAEPDPVSEEELADEESGAWPDARGGGQDESDGIERITRLDDCPLPEGYQIPEDYQVRADGIWYLTGRWGPSRASWAWLFPVQVYIDPDGDQLVELTWRDHGHWVSRLIRRAITKSGRKLVTEAGDAGLPITDSEAKDAERWLAAAEIANAAVIPRHPVARQLGWQNDGRTFVTSQDSPWRVEPKYQQQIPALRAHRAHGTLAGWQAAVKNAEPYPVVQAGIYEGLAPALLHPLGLDSFTVDHSGKSTRGKTITVAAGLSCWADPSEKGDGLLSWQTTVIEAERRFNLVNGLPVVLDETRLVKDPGVVDTILYEVPKNHGKPRGGGWPSMLPWRTIALSTGEQPATSFTTHQGASARVLSTQRAPFGTEGESSRVAAEAVKCGIEANYGTAGPAFVAKLQAVLGERGGAESLRRRHAEMTGKLRGQTDMSARRAPLIAVIGLAAELAARWGITPFEAPGPADWLTLYTAADDPRDNRPEMALDVVREFLAAHHDKMYGCGDGDHPPATGWIGHDAPEGPALLPEKLREELKRRGYDLDAVLPGWLEMGALVTLDSQRPSHLIPRRTAGRQTKHVVFRRDIISPAEPEQ